MEIQRADRQSRRAALLHLSVAAALGAGVLGLLAVYRQALLSWLRTTEAHVQVGIIAVALFLLLVPLLLMAAWVWRFGLRVVRGGRHPPAGVKVIRDTQVVHGGAARLYGRLYQALAALFVLAALSILWFAWMLWRLE